jgi:hypothetical protein
MQHVEELLALTVAEPPGTPFGVDLWLNEVQTTERGQPPDRPFQVRWGDRVINVWAENYRDLPTALVRAALVLRAAETGAFFRDQATDDGVWEDPDGGDGPTEFVAAARVFLDSQLSGPDPDHDAGG